MDPLLIDVPDQLETERLRLRRPRHGDGAALNAAILASLDELRPWAAWVKTPPTLEQSESFARGADARFAARIELVYHIRERDAGDDGPLAGVISLSRMDWSVPRFEIGYWRRTGYGRRGVMTEALVGLSRMAFDVLRARRVELRIDDDNAPSWRVAERAGFTLEGVLRNERINVDGAPCHMRVYARVRGIEELDEQASNR
jgi:RimJ/RimL family protein N-acetyltransferase